MLLAIEQRLGIVRHPSAALRLFAVILGIAGIVLQLICIVVFHRQGGGTASPVAPTVRLVTSGPYRHVRNPLNLGELAVFLALAAWFASPALLLYTALSWLAFHLFIVRYEEPLHTARFGEAYVEYRGRVGRWLPRVTRS